MPMFPEGAVVVLLQARDGVVIVRDPTHADPQWKFPGGNIEPGETSIRAAQRELKQETGVFVLAISRFEVLLREKRYTKIPHTRVFVGVDAKEYTSAELGLKPRGETGEETKVVSVEDLNEQLELKDHRKLLRDLARLSRVA